MCLDSHSDAMLRSHKDLDTHAQNLGGKQSEKENGNFQLVFNMWGGLFFFNILSVTVLQ